MILKKENQNIISTTNLVIEPTERRVRVRFGDRIIADSKNALLLCQYGANTLPTYYFPFSDVDLSILENSSLVKEKGSTLRYWAISTNNKSLEKGAWSYVHPNAEHAPLKGYISFPWNEMDAWYEEEEEVFVHARDPYKRIDILASERHVRIEIQDKCIAQSTNPFLLFETNLPIRYYLSPKDVNFDILIESDYTTRCPYKGIAKYWSVSLGKTLIKNVFWSYPDPLPEVQKIRNLISFYGEELNVFDDGELLSRVSD